MHAAANLHNAANFSPGIQESRRDLCHPGRNEEIAMNSQISIPKDALAEFCQKHGIRRLAVFGSALREDFGPESDIDLLIEFERDRVPGLLGIAGIELKLSEIFGGRKVDLRTPEDLSPYFRQDVLDAAEVQYAQG